jgi:hypothetical protein
MIFYQLSAAQYQKHDITIHFPADQEKLARLIVDNLWDDIDTFQRQIGQYPELKIKIIMANDQEQYHNIIGESSPIIEFSQAVYIPSRATILLQNPRDRKNFSQLREIILHEYIHHFVHDQIKNPPLWFNEGMAVYYSGGLSYRREMNFIKNYLLGNSLNLNQMRQSYPENRIEWESFYAKSALAVKYLATEKPQRFQNFWQNLQADRDFSSAFIRSFYFTPREFAYFFEQYSQDNFHLGLLLSGSGLIWALLPLIFLWALLKRSLKNRRIKKRWQEYETRQNGEKNSPENIDKENL